LAFRAVGYLPSKFLYIGIDRQYLIRYNLFTDMPALLGMQIIIIKTDDGGCSKTSCRAVKKGRKSDITNNKKPNSRARRLFGFFLPVGNLRIL
jgi:hypothetical protein